MGSSESLLTERRRSSFIELEPGNNCGMATGDQPPTPFSTFFPLQTKANDQIEPTCQSTPPIKQLMTDRVSNPMRRANMRRGSIIGRGSGLIRLVVFRCERFTTVCARCRRRRSSSGLLTSRCCRRCRPGPRRWRRRRRRQQHG